MGRTFAEQKRGSAAFVPCESQRREWPCTFSFANQTMKRIGKISRSWKPFTEGVPQWTVRGWMLVPASPA